MGFAGVLFSVSAITSRLGRQPECFDVKSRVRDIWVQYLLNTAVVCGERAQSTGG